MRYVDGTSASRSGALFGGHQPIFWDDRRCVSHHLVLRRGLLLKGSLGLDCWTTGHDGVQWYHNSIQHCMTTLPWFRLLGLVLICGELLESHVEAPQSFLFVLEVLEVLVCYV